MGDNQINRRAAVGKVTAMAGAGLLATVAPAAAESAAEDNRGRQVRESFKVVDKRGRQAFLVDTRKPPILHGGKVYPATERGGPDPATYLVFNDENGSEKGGIVASANAASVSLDYANAQAITLATQWRGKDGGAFLSMTRMPDPSLPLDKVPPTPPALQLGYNTLHGTVLVLADSKGRERIRIEVDEKDVPRIAILDEHGKVVGQLPNQPST